MNNKKRRILFITERRADYSRLKPIMRAVNASDKLEMLLLVTGVHLLKNFGETQKVIQDDGFKIDAVLPMFNEDDSDDGASMVKGMGRVMIGMADAFKKLKPDLIFAGFDIGANYAAAIVGMHMNIVVSHIQGGEVTGTVDEVIRHAMTKFSHIHFAATEQSVERIIKMGENPKYVFNVGSPSLDTIRGVKYYPKERIFDQYKLDPNKKLLILLQHPVTTEVDDVVSQINTSISALKKMIEKHNAQAIAIYSNNDAGGRRILENLKNSGIKIFPHIVYEDFLRLMKYAHALVGNSSTGIHETPSFGLPTINIGTRQQHRERGENVIDVGHDIDEIADAIEKALVDEEYRERMKNVKNPYDNGDTAKKVVYLLETLEFPPIQKVITY